ncbi:MAG: NAD-dependent deacetylase [Rhizobiales bacterium 32-66-8]|nr:MAG: NAD-dependent deacetylase [Rhizobiales bacterium 32-66-8]
MIFDGDLKGAQLRLADLIAQSAHAVAFTGAGISTECGIPDFRSPGGLWTQNKPIPFDVFVAHRAARTEAWRRKFAMDAAFSGAQPGRGHRALTRLLEQGQLAAIITQNIDGLHQESGAPAEAVVELHGNTTYATCLDCSTRYELVWVRREFEQSGGHAPDCPACGGPVKTATISFGQAMPEREMARADRLTRASDLFIVIGSSLVVFPAASLPLLAKKRGARLVIINREPTEFDPLADLVVRSDIGDLLAPFAEDARPLL